MADKTMRDAALFFDNHLKNKKKMLKQDLFIERKTKQLAQQTRTKLKGQINSLNPKVNLSKSVLSAASTTQQQQQQQQSAQLQKALVGISQSVHNNTDQASIDLHNRVMKALRENDGSSQTTSEIRTLAERVQRTTQTLDSGSGGSGNSNTLDENIWEPLHEVLEPTPGEPKSKPKPKAGKNSPLSSSTVDLLNSGLAGFLGVGGPLLILGVKLKQEYGEDVKNQLGRFKRWLGFEKDESVDRENIRQRSNRNWKIRFSRLGATVGLLLKTVAAKASAGAAWTWNRAKGLGRFLGRNKGLALAAAGAGAVGLASHYLGSNNTDETDTDTAQSTGAGITATPDSAGNSDKTNKKWKLSDITEMVRPITNKVQNLFSGLGDSVKSKWIDFCGGVSKGYSDLLGDTGKATIQINMLKDKVEEARDEFWSGIKGLFSGAWNRLKNLLPKPVAAALTKTKNMVVSAGNWIGNKLGLNDNTQIKMPTTTGYSGEALTVGTGVDLQGLNPAVRSNLYAMAQDYFKQTGKKIKVNSAKRSHSEQEGLFNSKPGIAAKPGMSMHEYGFALDITNADGTATKLDNMGLLAKYGFMRPIEAKEPWHVEPIAIQGAKAAIRAGRASVNQIVKTPDSKIESEGTVAQAATATVKTRVGGTSTASVAPSTTPYKQVASVSDVIDVDAPDSNPTPAKSGAKTFSGPQTSVGSVPLYLGDMSMLMLNLGMTGG